MHGEVIPQEEINQKFLRSLSQEWTMHTIVWRNKPKIETLSLDDLFNNLKAYESEVMRTSSSTANLHNVSFLSSSSTNSTTRAVNTAQDGTADSSTTIENLSDVVIYSFFSIQLSIPQFDNEDQQQIHPDDLEEMDLRQKFSKATVTVNTARPINAAHPKRTMNAAKPRSCFSNSAHSIVERPINNRTTSKNSKINQKVNTARPKALLNVVQGNKSYLIDYKEIYKGFVAFGGNSKGGKITGKGKIRNGKLDFEDVYFVKELKFNLFSVLKMCDKKNSVLFTDTACVVLSPDFKLTDESHVLLKVPRKDNVYSVDLKNVVPQEKKKQHRASCKTKTVSSISQPLQMLHMDLFGPTFVKSLMKKMYCLVATDDFSRFSWVFLATKDETSEILKTFITGIENLINLRVKVIRCDNETEFKNRVMNQFCEMKGIKREFSVARTPQQNKVAKRKNKILIEAARTMLAD
nr:hypothetical protein [Tanacetum cinerariifolium]